MRANAFKNSNHSGRVVLARRTPIRSRHFSRRIKRRHDLSISSVASEPWLMCTISVFSWTTAAFQHQRQDQGARHPPAQDQWPVSTNLFSFASSPSSSLPPCPTSHARPSLAPPLAHRHRVSRSPLILCLCLLHTPHGPLFPVRDPLRRVSPGQVLETRGFHRKSILRPFHSSFLRFSSSHAGSPRLLVLPSFSSALFLVLLAAQSATLSRLGCPSTQWMKANAREEWRREPEMRGDEIKKD